MQYLMEGRSIMANIYQLPTLMVVSALLLLFIHWIYKLYVKICFASI